MIALSDREKNLGLFVLVVCLLSGWWYLGRVLRKKSAELEAQMTAVDQQVKQMNASLASLQASAIGNDPAATNAGPTIVQSALTMTLLKELTVPEEAENVRVLSVTRSEAGTFNMQVEGRFAEMMRFLSYFERNGSRFSVGNIQLGKDGSGGDGGGEKAWNIKGSIQIVMKG